MGAYNKQYKQQCWKCGKYGHKPGDRRCPENKNDKHENNKETERYSYKKISKECATIAVRKGILVKIVRHVKTAIIKILKKWKELLMEMRMICCMFIDE